MNSGNMVSIITETKLRSNTWPWITNKFDGVQVFISGLDTEFFGASMAVIINNFLAQHVLKVKKIPGQLILVYLLFKDRLSVSILGLYARASVGMWFSQALEINSIISKVVNSSFFVILDSNFNENDTKKSVSFNKCLKIGFVNLFRRHFLVKVPIWCNFKEFKKVIDYIFVSENLISTVIVHEVDIVSEFFNTDHKTVLVSRHFRNNVSGKHLHKLKSFVNTKALGDLDEIIIDNISLKKLVVVLSRLLDNKAAGLSGISNKLWKHCGNEMTNCLLDLLNFCLKLSNIPNLWKKAWVSMISKPYKWKDVLTNTQLIVLIETTRKILSKILLDHILSICSMYNILQNDNFLVFKGTSTQSSVFAVGLIVEDTLEKGREIWLVLQDMCKYNSVG
ncbi:hypothetical protein G9A89_017227 [Geosiphon pyriformis]|nr:hypothetical protein G9A89_017227 [Geosiphon pyriformis]